MKFRPTFTLRFRDNVQDEQVTTIAANMGLSINEYILRCIEHNLPTGKKGKS